MRPDPTRSPADGRGASAPTSADASWEASIARVMGEPVTHTSHVIRRGLARGAVDPEYGLIPTSERGAPFPTHSLRRTLDDV